MKVSFNLKRASSSTETAIVCLVRFDGYTVKLATGLSIEPKLWDRKRQKAKKGAAIETATNAALSQIESDVAKVFTKFAADSEAPTPERFKERYKILQEPESNRRKLVSKDLLAIYESYIEESHFATNTKKNHGKTKNHLKAFAETRNMKLTFERLDMQTFDAFTRYLLTVKKKTKDPAESESAMTTDSAWNILKSLKAFLAKTREQGLHRNDEFRKLTRKKLPKGDTSDKVYLSADELEAIRNLDLTEHKRLDRVRDLFVFLCFTGIRFGDSQAIHPENINGDTLTFVTGKNRKSVTTPLLGPAKEILKKYDGRLPKISNQKANNFLTEILQSAGIDTPVHVVSYTGTERKEKVIPKYEAIGMHTAKRTYVTLLRQRGVSIEALMKATGNSRDTLERYILRTEKDALQEIVDAWS